ncbi:MAG: hypothetical protein ACRDMZ_11865, partial [Solirubrobacteraceae bacterium]
LQVIASVSQSGARPAVLGLLVGSGAAALASRALSSAVYGVRPFDPLVIGGVSIVLAVAIFAAAYLAARRALRVDPVESLRFE